MGKLCLQNKYRVKTISEFLSHIYTGYISFGFIWNGVYVIDTCIPSFPPLQQLKISSFSFTSSFSSGIIQIKTKENYSCACYRRRIVGNENGDPEFKS